MPEISSAGVIGLGSAGLKHCRPYLEAGLKTCYYDPQHAEDVTYGLRAYCAKRADLNDVLRCDVVSICSPDDTHVDYFGKVLAGSHVFMEKPITHSAAALDTFTRMCGTTEVVDCHLPLRYHDPFVRAIGQVAAGCIGKIVSIDMAYHYGRPKKLEGWRGKIPNYSLIVGGGIHLIDIALLLTGSTLNPLRPFSAQRSSYDARATFWLGADVLCTLTTTAHEHVPHQHTMRIVGTHDVIDIHNEIDVDLREGVRVFLDKVKNGISGNIREAIAANAVCINLASVLK